MRARRSILFLLCLPPVFAQLTPQQKSDSLESFEIVWRTVRDRHPDTTFNGLDWRAVHDATRPRIAAAHSIADVRAILVEMVGKLGTSHYAIIPRERYQSEGASGPAVTAETAGSSSRVSRPQMPSATPPVAQSLPQPPPSSASPELAREPVPESAEPARKAEPGGKLVTFGNLPETRVFFESRKLPGGAGYIRFNEFLDPVSLMPQFEAAMKQFSKAPGIILDLRGNPGGIGIMAMGIAGFFVEKEGRKLGEMKMRDTTLKFVVFPRPGAYKGPLAILVDEGSASTTEILAQGLQDLGRARIFGTRTAGAALPSDIIRLPDGDGFQFAQATYISEKGRVLEGAGVTPDVEVLPNQEARVSGHDPVIEAAESWIDPQSR